MTITRKITSITTAAALAATALVPMTTAASAEGWRNGGNRGGGYGYSERHAKGDWGHDGRRHRYGHRRHRRHNNGKYIALGVGALMLGVILSEAGRRH